MCAPVCVYVCVCMMVLVSFFLGCVIKLTTCPPQPTVCIKEVAVVKANQREGERVVVCSFERPYVLLWFVFCRG